MFWNRKPKCPITSDDEEWVVKHLNWIDKHILELTQQPTILPTKAFFDWNFSNQEEDAEYLLRKIGEYFNIETTPINLRFYSEEDIELARGVSTQKEEGQGTAGLYVQYEQEFLIWIEIQQLKNPLSLIATIAHELSHFVLIGQKGVFLEGEENEWLTDLLVIAYGFGIFQGNARFSFSQWQSGDGWGGWQYSIQGYLPQQVTAFAMAEIESRRIARMPDWIQFLQGDFKSDFKKSMKYLMTQKN